MPLIPFGNTLAFALEFEAGNTITLSCRDDLAALGVAYCRRCHNIMPIERFYRYPDHTPCRNCYACDREQHNFGRKVKEFDGYLLECGKNGRPLKRSLRWLHRHDLHFCGACKHVVSRDISLSLAACHTTGLCVNEAVLDDPQEALAHYFDETGDDPALYFALLTHGGVWR